MSDEHLKFSLHLIQQNMTSEHFRNQIVRMTSAQDKLVFMGDSTFDLAVLSPLIDELNDNLTIYVIDSDIQARALKGTLNKKIKLINFDEFVSLTIKANKVTNW